MASTDAQSICTATVMVGSNRSRGSSMSDSTPRITARLLSTICWAYELLPRPEEASRAMNDPGAHKTHKPPGTDAAASANDECCVT